MGERKFAGLFDAEELRKKLKDRIMVAASAGESDVEDTCVAYERAIGGAHVERLRGARTELLALRERLDAKPYVIN